MVATVRAKKRLALAAGYDRLFRQLTVRQRAAVEAIEGPVIVLAGPGTGKTQVLTMRIANILRVTQMDPWNILCLTFTESAAAAMRSRLSLVIGEAAYAVRMTTFHSFCHEVMVENPDAFPAAAGWEVLSAVERVELFRSLLDELPGRSALKPFGHPYVFVGDLIAAVQWLKKEGVTPARLRALVRYNRAAARKLSVHLKPFFALLPHERTSAACAGAAQTVQTVLRSVSGAETLRPVLAAVFERYKAERRAAGSARAEGKSRTKFKNELKKIVDRMTAHGQRWHALTLIFARYQEQLTQRGRIDFEDMILFVLERLRNDGALLSRLQEQWQYILVDEYQDTNGAQNEMLWLLGSFYPNPNIFVVGDDQQSIFRFQGASLENLLSFYEQYRVHVQVLSLTDNWRTQQTILDAAASVIARNTAALDQFGVDRQLRARGGAPMPLERLVFETEDAENYFVASRIQKLLAAGVPGREIAVLYRNNRDAESLSDLLLRLSIPVHVSAGEDVLADRRVQQLLALLTAVAEPRDDVLAEALFFDFFALDELDALKVVYAAGRGRRGVLTLLGSRRHLREAEVLKAEPFLAFARQVARWRKLAANLTLPQLFDTVLQESGLLQRLMGDGRPSGRRLGRTGDEARTARAGELAALHHLTELFNELRRMCVSNHELTVRQFTERMRLLREHGVPLSAEPWQTRAEAVQLLTAHKAKGLEFRHVFIIRLTDRHWGNVRERSRLTLPLGIVRHDPIVGTRNNEDERRLFYVALTRAKERVYLSYARHAVPDRERSASLFWHELPPECVVDPATLETEEVALQRLVVLRQARPVGPSPRLHDWLRERLQSYVLSVTHLNNYLTCPRLFLYRNVVLVPAAKTRSLAFGGAVHGGLRDFMVRAARERTLPGVSFLLERFRAHLEREILTAADFRDSLLLGQAALGAYHAQYKRAWVLDVHLEYSFRSHGVHLGSARITGTLDKVEIIDAKQKLVNVVDYKTGNPDTAGGRLKVDGQYRRQLVFYQLLCDHSSRFPYRMVSGELDFVQSSARTGKFTKRRLEISQDETAKLRDVITQAWEEICSLAFLERPGCGECAYCKSE